MFSIPAIHLIFYSCYSSCPLFLLFILFLFLLFILSSLPSFHLVLYFSIHLVPYSFFLPCPLFLVFSFSHFCVFLPILFIFCPVPSIHHVLREQRNSLQQGLELTQHRSSECVSVTCSITTGPTQIPSVWQHNGDTPVADIHFKYHTNHPQTRNKKTQPKSVSTFSSQESNIKRIKRRVNKTNLE